MRLTVPASVLAEAAYPLVVDPAISLEYRVSDPVEGPSPAQASEPAVSHSVRDRHETVGEAAVSQNTREVVVEADRATWETKTQRETHRQGNQSHDTSGTYVPSSGSLASWRFWASAGRTRRPNRRSIRSALVVVPSGPTPFPALRLQRLRSTIGGPATHTTRRRHSLSKTR